MSESKSPDPESELEEKEPNDSPQGHEREFKRSKRSHPEQGDDGEGGGENGEENPSVCVEDHGSEQNSSGPEDASGESSAIRFRRDRESGEIEIHIEGGDDDEDDDDLLRRVLAAARSQGIPLEFLSHMFEAQDDEDVEYPFQTPTSLSDVADFIQSDQCRSIIILAGAGMSVVSGIPDFRSSNGLYATLKSNSLSATPEQVERIRYDPSYSLDQRLFLENPLPCLEVIREFVLGVQQRKWKATLAHRFVELLQTKTRTNENSSKLTRLYTQNIDGLEDQCPGLPHSQRIAVHGSMDEAICDICKAKMEVSEFSDLLEKQVRDILMYPDKESSPIQSTPIRCPKCGSQYVKPNIVLFRSSLPKEFFQKVPQDTGEADLLLIMGTSLGVAPANSLVWRVPKTAMRVLINREPVGWQLGLDWNEGEEDEEVNRRSRDYFAQGNCENVCLELMEHLGWLDDLRPLLENDDLPEESARILRAKLEQVDNAKENESNDCKPATKTDEEAKKVTE
eukprot:Nitzschia sp. Nitz4//scaffold143_size57137//37508//39165//NITZ4_006517-RA/size57137-processed-gene-0.20-mRNA-1//-1//CDS//3329536455//4523//frame0